MKLRKLHPIRLHESAKAGFVGSRSTPGRLESAESRAAALVEQMTERELLGVLDGDTSILAGGLRMLRSYNADVLTAGAVPRLGLPGIRFTDGPRGVVVGHCTAFPAAIARGATWDPELEERIGEAIGVEARAAGANLFAGVCVNLVRHPGWGRTQETYGEDSVLLGAMGAALTRGVRRNVMACVKHFALNSMEEARFKVDVEVDETTLHEIYLPHFKAVIDAGADAVMTSYNRVRGEWAGESRQLLTEVLRERWGFVGFTMTDFVFGLRDPIGSLLAGQDLEMPFAQQRARALPAALADGRLTRDVAERSATRIVAAYLRHQDQRDSNEPGPEVICSREHRALAREAAAKSCVLLRNERSLLPLILGTSLAVIGPLADQANLGDIGSSQVRPPSTCSVLEGLSERDDVTVTGHSDGRDLAAAAELARGADVAVVVVGLTAEDEGESFLARDPDSLRLLGPPFSWPGVARALSAIARPLTRRLHPAGGDRRQLGLKPADEQLIAAIAAANAQTVVVLIGGSVIDVTPWHDLVRGLLLAWYPGMEGGRAIADVLLGDAEPCGRLPIAMAARADHLPGVDWDAEQITYDRWWGQRKLDRDRNVAAYPLGFGLGYTTFEVTGIEVAGETATVSARNTGSRVGGTVVQLYAQPQDGPETDVRRLVGFASISAAAGAEVTESITLDFAPLGRLTGSAWAVTATQHAGGGGISFSLRA
jgi:beta-glucosidase